MEELQRFNATTFGREQRMIELKKEVNDLAARLGEPPRYSPPDNTEGNGDLAGLDSALVR